MLRHPRLQAILLTLFCVTLLLGRVAGAHMHLCFDGKEPASAFHLGDLGIHHSTPGVDLQHADTDVAVAGEALSKGKLDWNLPLALLAAIVLLGISRIPPSFTLAGAQRLSVPTPDFLRPPLRGPPLFTSL